MQIDHKAGEKLFVDYAGDKLAIVDTDSGKQRAVATFRADAKTPGWFTCLVSR